MSTLAVVTLDESGCLGGETIWDLGDRLGAGLTGLTSERGEGDLRTFAFVVVVAELIALEAFAFVVAVDELTPRFMFA